MTWFEKKFDDRYGGIRRSNFKPHSPKNIPLFSFSLTGKIILANVLFFIGYYFVFLIIGNSNENYAFLLRNVALQPLNFLEGRKIWTVISHMFMHANFSHLFMNMVSLIFIGSFVERLVGKKRFIWLYIIGGIISALFFVILAGFFGVSPIGERIFGSPITFAVGASGAIFALGGLLAMLIPKMKVLVFFIIPMPMWLAMTSLLAIFWILSFVGGIPIGNSAHLGGLITGLIYGAYLKYKYPKKTSMISRFFS